MSVACLAPHFASLMYALNSSAKALRLNSDRAITDENTIFFTDCLLIRKYLLHYTLLHGTVANGGCGPLVYSVPTPPERTGDFSALLALCSQYQIYDPRSEEHTSELQSLR